MLMLAKKHLSGANQYLWVMNDDQKAELAIKRLSSIYDEMACLYEAIVDEDDMAVRSSVLSISQQLAQINASPFKIQTVNPEVDGDGS